MTQLPGFKLISKPIQFDLDYDTPKPILSIVPKIASTKDLKVADKFRTLADNLQRQIDDKFADRLENTPKRQREAASQRLEGLRLILFQSASRRISFHLPPPIVQFTDNRNDINFLCITLPKFIKFTPNML